MTSARKEHNNDARAKGAASVYVACSCNPVTTLKIPAAMRAKGYLDTEAVDRALQMQVRREVKKLKGGVSAAASAALSAEAAMVALSSTVTMRALAFIPPEDAPHPPAEEGGGSTTQQARPIPRRT
jgi:hypothetical protein